MAEIAGNIESRMRIEDVQRLLEQKVSKPDLQFLISDKVGFEDLKQYVDNSQHNFNS